MDALETIHTRRSIREYQDRPVPDALVEQVIAAAMMAPSAGNARPWQFVVISDAGLKAQIPRIHPHASMAADAPVSVLVCGDPGLERYPGNWIADCSAATQNLLLAAHAQGLGSVWTGVYPEKERMAGFRQLLGLPERLMPLALLPLGYPAEGGGRAERFDREKIHRNGW
jgi:nitroreductase